MSQTPDEQQTISNNKIIYDKTRKIYVCCVCEKIYSINNDYNRIVEHIQSTQHQSKMRWANGINTFSQWEFNHNLCYTFLKLDIPLSRLRNKVMKNFHKKYTTYNVYTDITLHNNNVIGNLYNEIIEEIKKIDQCDHILISSDESSDLHNKFVVNVYTDVNVSHIT